MTSSKAALLARQIDISCVRASHGIRDVRALAEQARAWNCINAHVLPHWLTTLADLLIDSETLPAAPIGFPSGGSTTETKCREAELVIDAGALEVDIVINIGRLVSGDFDYVESELRRVMSFIPISVIAKGIIETSLLSRSEIRQATRIVAGAGMAFVKTGTGWAGPVTPDDVSTIAEELEIIGAESVGIKAAGGIRSLSDIDSLASAGATRFGIGLTSAVEILKEADRA